MSANFACVASLRAHARRVRQNWDTLERMRELARLGPLSEVFAYAPELGCLLRHLDPALWRRFKSADPRWRPAQADDLAFLHYCEGLPEIDLPLLLCAAVGDIATWQRELDSSLVCERSMITPDAHRPAGSWPMAQVPAIWLAPGPTSSRARVYAPSACLDYPLAPPELGWAREMLEGRPQGECTPATDEQIARVHPLRLLRDIDRFAASGGGRFDPETPVIRETPAAIRAAAGAIAKAVRDGLGDRGKRVGICLARPGSHHAGVDRPMGTCLINNLAVGATEALSQGVERVAIVDVDAHHGNGTQEIFCADPRVLAASIHQFPFYPGTGLQSADPGILNRPVRTDAGQSFAEEWTAVLGALVAHRPGLILVEASFDAHELDGISELGWRDEDYQRVFHDLRSLSLGLGVPLVLEVGAAATQVAFRRGLAATLHGLAQAEAEADAR